MIRIYYQVTSDRCRQSAFKHVGTSIALCYKSFQLFQLKISMEQGENCHIG